MDSIVKFDVGYFLKNVFNMVKFSVGCIFLNSVSVAKFCVGCYLINVVSMAQVGVALFSYKYGLYGEGRGWVFSCKCGQCG